MSAVAPDRSYPIADETCEEVGFVYAGGGKAMAIAFTLIETAKLNNVDPQAWLTHVLIRIADQKITRLDDFLPCRYIAEAA